MSVCKPLGLIDDLTRFFLPTNQRRSRISSSATMSVTTSYKPDIANSSAPVVMKLAPQKPQQHWHKQLLRGRSVRKRLSPAEHVGKRLKQTSVNTSNKASRNVNRGKPVSDGRKATKPKQRRHRQYRDHVESLIDGLTDYFAAHGERRLKSPALKGVSSYGSESHQVVSSHQLDSPTEISKQLLPSMYSSELDHRQPRKQKKATVEKLFDGLSTFFSVQSEHRRQPTSPILPGSYETSVRSDVASMDSSTGMPSSETKLNQLMNMPLKDMDRKMMAAKNSHLKGLFDGLSHLYTAHGDRKRKSTFFYTAQPTKGRPPANQRPVSTVKQEPVGTVSDVQDKSAASQTVKVSKEKQQRTQIGKLSTNKSQLLKKSLKSVTFVAKRQLSSSGLLL